jgi:hypothetical protein
MSRDNTIAASQATARCNTITPDLWQPDHEHLNKQDSPDHNDMTDLYRTRKTNLRSGLHCVGCAKLLQNLAVEVAIIVTVEHAGVVGLRCRSLSLYC